MRGRIALVLLQRFLGLENAATAADRSPVEVPHPPCSIAPLTSQRDPVTASYTGSLTAVAVVILSDAFHWQRRTPKPDTPDST